MFKLMIRCALMIVMFGTNLWTHLPFQEADYILGNVWQNRTWPPGMSQAIPVFYGGVTYMMCGFLILKKANCWIMFDKIYRCS